MERASRLHRRAAISQQSLRFKNKEMLARSTHRHHRYRGQWCVIGPSDCKKRTSHVNTALAEEVGRVTLTNRPTRKDPPSAVVSRRGRWEGGGRGGERRVGNRTRPRSKVLRRFIKADRSERCCVCSPLNAVIL